MVEDKPDQRRNILNREKLILPPKRTYNPSDVDPEAQKILREHLRYAAPGSFLDISPLSRSLGRILDGSDRKYRQAMIFPAADPLED